MSSAAIVAKTSPFFSRTYGGYTASQIEFAREHLGELKGADILDPMGGQAYALGDWAIQGANVTIIDVNPGALALATLRDPAVIAKSASLAGRLSALLSRQRSRIRRAPPDFTEDWLADSLKDSLSDWGAKIGVQTPDELQKALQGRDLFQRFATAATVLAARRVASFQRTDNLTWLKPGGRVKVATLREAILPELQLWLDWISHSANGAATRGRLRVRWDQERTSRFDDRTSPSSIITSPPYANRLDYTRLWAPELAVLEAMAKIDVRGIKEKQLGSNLVREIELRSGLPRRVISALRGIKDDPTPFSESYYYRFFLNYADGLAAQCDRMADVVKPGGTVIVFVRDTIRKDVLFPTGDLIEWAFTKRHRFTRACRPRSIVIRSHVGYRRKSQVGGLFGLAQREHWFVFRRRTDQR